MNEYTNGTGSSQEQDFWNQNGYQEQNDQNQGYENQGYQNQGYQNQGYQNQGYQNQGYQNQGYQNQGYQNQGYYGQGYDNGMGGYSPARRLVKSSTNKMVCGVCAGIGEYFHWDPTIVRLVWIGASVILGAGFLGLVAYFIAAVVMPEG